MSNTNYKLCSYFSWCLIGSQLHQDEVESFPDTDCQRLISVNDEHKLWAFYEKHIATEFASDTLGEEHKDYVVQINGGNNKFF